MSNGTYRVGPSDFFTPGDLSSDADAVNAQIALLDSEILAHELAPHDFTEQWESFESNWRDFYSDHFGGFFSNLFSALNDSNRDDLIRYETQLAAYQKAAANFGAQLIAPLDPSTGSKDNIGDQLKAQGLPSLTTVVVVIIAVMLVSTWLPNLIAVAKTK